MLALPNVYIIFLCAFRAIFPLCWQSLFTPLLAFHRPGLARPRTSMSDGDDAEDVRSQALTSLTSRSGITLHSRKRRATARAALLDAHVSTASTAPPSPPGEPQQSASAHISAPFDGAHDESDADEATSESSLVRRRARTHPVCQCTSDPFRLCRHSASPPFRGTGTSLAALRCAPTSTSSL